MLRLPRSAAFVLPMLFLAIEPVSLAAQDELDAILGFETADLTGWLGGPPETLSSDSLVAHGGQWAGRLERDGDAAGPFSTFTYHLPVRFEGDSVELVGWLRTEAVEGFAGLWMRQDGIRPALQFDNMRRRGLNGTTPWTEYRIVLPLDGRARQIFLGALLAGRGTVWVDDLQLRVDGVSVAKVPVVTPEPTAVERDTTFDNGSGLELRTVTAVQVANLSLLGRVWGFVKYHHPKVTGGKVNWDYELFRVLPRVLAAADESEALHALSTWLVALGEPSRCDVCATLPTELQTAPDLAWIDDRRLVDAALGSRLRRIYERRPAASEQYYVTHAPGVGNPEFDAEAAYAGYALPDAGFRLLALYRYWNVIEYWFPYRDVIGTQWESVLEEFIPRVVAVDSPAEYSLLMLELAGRINDTHADVRGSSLVRPPSGGGILPVWLRFVDGKAVVAGVREPLSGKTELRVGDVLTEIDGLPVDSLMQAWRAFYPASNQAAQALALMQGLVRGEIGPVSVTGTRGGNHVTLDAERIPLAELASGVRPVHDLPGPTFRWLADDVAYLKLSTVADVDLSTIVAEASDAKVLVVDLRNYPSRFVVFELGGRLVDRPTDFVRFTAARAPNPGAFVWGPVLSLEPLQPRFTGKVAILVDETTLSQAEYTAMALSASPNAIVVGSTTAGADGNVSWLPLPGNLVTSFTGIGVFYPHGEPTQRVGITPDVTVRPTVQGIRDGRDEVLEKAVSHVLGRDFRLDDSVP